MTTATRREDARFTFAIYCSCPNGQPGAATFGARAGSGVQAVAADVPLRRAGLTLAGMAISSSESRTIKYAG
jgi:hypothetical protein